MCLKPYSNSGCQSRRKGLPWPSLARLQASYLRILIVPILLVCPQPASFLRAVPWQKKNVYEAELGSTSPSIGKEILTWQRQPTQKSPCSQRVKETKRRCLKWDSPGPEAGHIHLISAYAEWCFSVILLPAFPRYRIWVVWRHDGSNKFPIGGECERSYTLDPPPMGSLQEPRLWNALGAFTCDLPPFYNWPGEGAESLSASVLPSEEMFNDLSYSCKDTIEKIRDDV